MNNTKETCGRDLKQKEVHSKSSKKISWEKPRIVRITLSKTKAGPVGGPDGGSQS